MGDTRIEGKKAVRLITLLPCTQSCERILWRGARRCTFTRRINELSETERQAILEMLCQHCEHIDFQIRFRWSVRDMAFWDNRCCMHRAISDYWPEERKGRRVTIKTERPVQWGVTHGS